MILSRDQSNRDFERNHRQGSRLSTKSKNKKGAESENCTAQEDRSKDLWTTFNVVQENIIKGGLHAVKYNEGIPVRNVSSRSVKSIDGDVKLNRALWTLAQGLKEYKDGSVSEPASNAGLSAAAGE